MGAMAAVRGLVCDRLDDGDAVAILDESGQEKKGTATIGVKRQYVGCAGRISNAINVVYCSFATKTGHALVGARLAQTARLMTRRSAVGTPNDPPQELRGEALWDDGGDPSLGTVNG